MYVHTTATLAHPSLIVIHNYVYAYTNIHTFARARAHTLSQSCMHMRAQEQHGMPWYQSMMATYREHDGAGHAGAL